MAIPLLKAKKFLVFLLRVLLGLMWTLSGWSWLQHSNPTQKLVNALQTAIQKEQSFAFYQGFLEEFVIPHAYLFSLLVSWGEFLVGISLLMALFTRLGAWGAIFLLLNYSFMNGSLFSTFNLLFMGLHIILLLGNAGKWLGVDQCLHNHWKN